MNYLKFTYVDAVTGVSVADSPAKNGPALPAVVGLQFVWARESQYPTLTPELFGTCPDTSDTDKPGVTAVMTEAEWLAARQRENADRRAMTAQQIADRRWLAETGGIIWQGYGIATDRESRALIDQEMLAIDRGARADGEGWKCLDTSTRSIVFWKASNADFEAMSLAVRRHVRSCFDREEELLEALEAGTLTTEMLEDGWPG